jgi:hypothetical protein
MEVAVSIATKELWRHKFAWIIALLALVYFSPLWFDRNDFPRSSEQWHCRDRTHD